MKSTRQSEYQHFLVPIKSLASTARAVSYFREMLADGMRTPRVSLLHVAPAMDGDALTDERETAIACLMDESSKLFALESIATDVVVRRGELCFTVLDIAEQLHASTIVLTRSRISPGHARTIDRLHKLSDERRGVPVMIVNTSRRS